MAKSTIDRLFDFSRRVDGVNTKIDRVDDTIEDLVHQERKKIGTSKYAGKRGRQNMAAQRSNNRWRSQTGALEDGNRNARGFFNARDFAAHPNAQKYHELLINSRVPIEGGALSICGNTLSGRSTRGLMTTDFSGSALSHDITECIDASERHRADINRLAMRSGAVGELARIGWPEPRSLRSNILTRDNTSRIALHRFGVSFGMPSEYVGKFQSEVSQGQQGDLQGWNARIMRLYGTLHRGFMGWLKGQDLDGNQDARNSPEIARNFAFDHYDQFRVGFKPHTTRLPAPWDDTKWWEVPGLEPNFSPTAGMDMQDDQEIWGGDLNRPSTTGEAKAMLEASMANPKAHNYVKAAHRRLGPVKFLSPAYAIVEGARVFGSAARKLVKS